MQSLTTRLEALENQLFYNEEKGPEFIIFKAIDGRLNGVVDESKIVVLTSNGIDYDREQGENEETFILRVSALAKAKLLSPLAVPCLHSVTEDMLANIKKQA